MKARVLWMLCGASLVWAQPPADAPPPPRPWSAGLMMRADSQPYRGAGGDVMLLPFVTYRGERLEWFGPLLRYKTGALAGWQTAVHLLVDFPAYEEDDAPILRGMGDRETTLLAGLDASRPLGPLQLVLSVDTDTLGRHDGSQLSSALEYRIGSPRAPLSAAFGIGFHLQDDNWTRNAVGVPAANATPDRPAYEPGDSLHPFVSARILWRPAPRWTTSWLLRSEFLDATWRDSPLVSDDYRLTALLSLSYSL